MMSATTTVLAVALIVLGYATIIGGAIIWAAGVGR